ncbi:alpha,alpha-trehalose-phosphate synthase (UDP-forming) [Psychrobacter sp. 72-O-c]|uniref:alpha,alpha-trehalose-phosphate synthase (UDP-forming) n=1 Tax=Psychrobacter sp. 72-O-c TaxID=2774125 RepID=UPI00191A508F|nr:trehalose-6-phosphate synthase [Psychrobacter sp. 72-O-c]
MSRLIVLSNRVKMPDNNPMAGGLAVALHDVLIGNSDIWMGWNGNIVDAHVDTDDDCATNEFSSSKQTSLASADLQRANTMVTYVTIALTTKQYQHFYCGFANNVLWPLLHEQTDLISQAPQDYAGYQAVNCLFARQLKKLIQPNDVIWVHDYHFLSVAYYCRQLGMSNRIGFFLHIPFVPLAFWQQLDKSSELIKRLAYYDVLGTQTQQDKANCLAVFQHYLKGSFLKESHLKDPLINTSHTKRDFAKSNPSAGVQLMLNLDLDLESATTHRLVINAYPIGVNVAKIQQQVVNLSSPLSLQAAKDTQKKNTMKPAAQQIIAVDRIDYSKGLLERFTAYRYFLQQYPTYQNQLKLLQIACPSRLDLPVYQRLYKGVRQAVNNVNQQFLPNACRTDVFKADASEADTFKNDDYINNWKAIAYSEKVLSQEMLMTAFWHSDVGWVNSLKDGMNLVAKEYIAAQNPDNPGVLLLSRYAGAAEQMQAAVIIDPHQPKSIIHGLKTALEMPLAQRKNRYQTLFQGLQQDNSHAWQQDFLDDLYLR